MFVNIKGVGDVNVDNVVMITKSMDKGKYVLVLSHGGKLTVSKKVRDEIVNGEEESDE